MLIALDDLKQSALIIFGLLLIWLCFFKAQLLTWIVRLNTPPQRAYRMIAWAMGGTAALVISLWKVWQHVTLQTLEALATYVTVFTRGCSVGRHMESVETEYALVELHARD